MGKIVSKKGIYLSLICITSLQASEQLEDITLNEQAPINTKVVKNVSGEEVKSADLADALNQKVPSVSLIRRSGIANDITLRGQKRDNINITIDGAKICGACVNRMDPPTSHVVTHAIDDIEIKEGPFDVEEFGTLSGSVKVTTKKPQKEFGGEVSINGGSFGYKKASGTITGGTEKVRVLLSASTEEGEQYEDGEGNNFSEQLANYTKDNPDTAKFNYAPNHENMDAFSKTMYMGKVFVDITDDQELKLSYTANRSDNILYPSSKMDAEYDDSDMLNLEYAIENLSSLSKKLELQVYQSEVEHPMSTKYRALTQKMGKYTTHYLTTKMRGVKLKNATDILGADITYGVDTSQRNWDGTYKVTPLNGTQPTKNTGKSINDVNTDNVGIFFKGKKSVGAWEIEGGLRYDDTTIETTSNQESNSDYTASSASLFASYKPNKDTKLFAGVGKSNRVPDARELYNIKYNTKEKPAKRVVNGNPSLNQTTNHELDMGAERYFPNGQLKFKTFYSKLKDYIYYNGSLKKNNFENIDAHIYGLELSGTYLATDEIYLDAGLSYKKGKKDTLTTGQTDRDLADISPLKLNASVTYDYDMQGNIQLSFLAVDRWSDIDAENGEQELAGYGTINLKTSREFDNGLTLLFGVDNLLDKTYTTTNTYKDLILMTDNSDTMLINEPGRYLYLNATYQF
jgi:iron complex outermembrane receptor protein